MASHMFMLSEDGLDMKITGFYHFSGFFHYELIDWHSFIFI